VHHDVGGGRGSAGRHAGRGFRPVVPFLVAAGSLILLMQPRISKWQEDNEHAWGPAAVSGVLVAVSVYNGYFDAGSGILLIGLLLLTTEPVLHRANAIKNVLLAASDILPGRAVRQHGDGRLDGGDSARNRHDRRRAHQPLHRPARPPRHSPRPYRLHGFRPHQLADHQLMTTAAQARNNRDPG
jgi:hypothetical protein